MEYTILGTSKEYLSRALKKFVPRDQVVIASKVYFNPGRLSREAIQREIDGTLKRLGTDYLEEPYLPHKIIGAIGANPPEGTVLLDVKK